MDTPAFPSAAVPPCADAGTLPAIDIGQLRGRLAVARRRVRARHYLFRNGQPFHALYWVEAGFLKACELSPDGREQVTGFRMPGDLMGVGAIGLDRYTCDAIALQDSLVCELPFPAVLRACVDVPSLQVALATAMAGEIRQHGAWMRTVGTRSAERRVGAFLLDLACRFDRLGSDGCHLPLRMGRAEIASFLTMTHESVSRALMHLQAQGYLAVGRRDVTLLDRPGLRRFVCPRCAA